MAHSLTSKLTPRLTNPRSCGVQTVEARNLRAPSMSNTTHISERFGSHVFSRAVMQRMLPKEIFKNVIEAMEGRGKIREEFADSIASAMKEWACSLGATHYCHWFQPLTGSSAEKHDAFIDWQSHGEMIERFAGKQLIQGEPDASSFPSGGLRSTYEARGYTGWDPTSPAFLWRGGDGLTLCIPSFFFSWTGEALDTRIPLHRSDKALSLACKRLLKLTGIKASHVFSTLGLEQEYFVVDRALRNLRPDLVLLGRTVFGACPPKGQELQDHYFASVKDRILSYMQDFEDNAIELGIPIKTRHNEVAPAQHEIAPTFENSSLAVDHNILLMELMRQVAVHHHLSCLLDEKPFAGLNGSGKHSNWSLCTDTGINLLDPSDTPENNIHFLILLTAILQAVHRHAALLRASVGSASNDFRLGGHEAPPAIISVYLGADLEAVLDEIEEKGSYARHGKNNIYDLGILELPNLSKDNTDRNRTSPFAFTGNKFEFRAVGSSANPAFPITVLNTVVAESLNELLDQIEKELKGKKSASDADILKAAFPVIRKSLKASRAIRFSGDNYTAVWEKEAKKRGLPNLKKSLDSFPSLCRKETIRAFQGVLTESELQSRFEVLCESYAAHAHIHTNLALDLFRSHIYPAALKTQEMYAASFLTTEQILGKKGKLTGQKEKLMHLVEVIEQSLFAADQLEEAYHKVVALPLEKKCRAYCDDVLVKAGVLRKQVDELERLVDDAEWPLPKYRELLFLI